MGENLDEDVDAIFKNFKFDDGDFGDDDFHYNSHHENKESDNDSERPLKKIKSYNEESDTDSERPLKKIKSYNEESDNEDESIKFDLTLKSKGAIGIFTHGEMIYNQTVKVPVNVSIQKQDFSSRGCFAITPNRKRNDPELFDLTKKAIEDVKGCVDENEYRIQLKEWVKNHPEDKNGVTFIDSVCPFYKQKKYEDKTYTIDKTSENIFFIIHVPASPRPIYIHVNLMECDQATLEIFFNTLGKLTEEDKTIITEFITERDKKMYEACVEVHTKKYENEANINYYNEINYNYWCNTTDHIPTNMDYYYYLREITITQLFKLIELSAKCLNVDNVNILDKSCNSLVRSKMATRKSMRYTTTDNKDKPTEFYENEKYKNFLGLPFRKGRFTLTNKEGGKRTRKNINNKRRKTRGKPRKKHLFKHR